MHLKKKSNTMVSSLRMPDKNLSAYHKNKIWKGA